MFTNNLMISIDFLRVFISVPIQNNNSIINDFIFRVFSKANLETNSNRVINIKIANDVLLIF